MIELRHLKKSFSKSDLFYIESLFFSDTGLVVIKGENGCGKTTLLNILSFIDSDYDGDILYDGKDIKSLKESERTKYRRDNIAYVFQKNNLISFCDIGTNLSIYDNGSENDERKPNTLSQGQQEIIAIKRGLRQKKKIYLFDEVLSSLDTKNRRYLIDQFKELSKDSLVIVVSHDVNIEDIADCIYEFKNRSMSVMKQDVLCKTPNNQNQKYSIHKKKIFLNYLFHSKVLSILNTLLMCLMLCFGYVGCEATEPDTFLKAFSAIKNEAYIILNDKSDLTSKEIISRFPNNAYECIFSDVPLARSSAMPEDGKVHCNQDTYNYYNSEKHKYILNGKFVLEHLANYDIVIDDSVPDRIFITNMPLSEKYFMKEMKYTNWNDKVKQNLTFFNETGFKSFYKLDSLPFELQDNVFYVFNKELVSDHITEYTTPTFIDRNSYEPDFNELFGDKMSANYLSLNKEISPYAVLMSNDMAQVLQNKCNEHTNVIISTAGIRFSLAAFLANHRYTMNIFSDKSQQIIKYNNLISAITDSRGAFTYGIFVYFMLVMIPLAEIALFYYTCFLNRNNIRSLYSLGMSGWEIYLMLLLPFFISFMLGTILGGILSLFGTSFQFISFGLGSLYTLALMALIFAGTYLIWARRKQR